MLSRQNLRESYFHLANTIFGLNFDKWYASGYWDDKFIPYVLYDGDLAVSSAGVCVNDILWRGRRKRYVQLSTVMTLPEYRNKGLNRWLIEYVLNEWSDLCDAVYLLANDTVVDFYPKFGFDEFTEYDFTVPVRKVEGEYRKLNMDNADDLNLMKSKYAAGNPFAEVKANNFSQFMFHCLNFQSENIYCLDQQDAVVIMEHDGTQMICYDILAGSDAPLDEILGVLANDDTQTAHLGFTPRVIEGCSVKETLEEDYHLFVLAGKENIFKEHKVKFPLLSRA